MGLELHEVGERERLRGAAFLQCRKQTCDQVIVRLLWIGCQSCSPFPNVPIRGRNAVQLARRSGGGGQRAPRATGRFPPLGIV